MLEEMDTTTGGENLTGQSPFSLHAISTISTQVVCILGNGDFGRLYRNSGGDAKVNRLWRNSAECSIM